LAVEVVYKFPDAALGDNKCGVGGKPVEGIIADFRTLKSTLKTLLPDHHCLNDIFEFNPTAENIARWLSGLIKSPHESVTVWETPDCGVTYVPEPTVLPRVVLNEGVAVMEECGDDKVHS
jgi:hypothetical protein